MPAAKAKRVIALLFDDPEAGTGRFITVEEEMRRLEIVDLGWLRWLLYLAEGDAIDESSIPAEVSVFTSLYLDDPAKSHPASAHEALDLVREFGAGLKRLIDGSESAGKWPITIGVVKRIVSLDRLTGGGPPLRASDWRGAFLLHATHLISRYGRRIRRCAYSDCRHVFVGDQIGHQKFCSPKCGANERQRRFREKTPDWSDYRKRGRLRRIRTLKGKAALKAANLKVGKRGSARG